MSDQKQALKPMYGVFILILSYLCGLTLSFIVALFIKAGTTRTFIMYAVPQICNVGAVFLGLKILGAQPKNALPALRAPALAPSIATPLITVSTMMLSLVLLYSFTYLSQRLGLSGGVQVPAWDSPQNIIFGILCLAILPSIGEELLFRGVLLKSFSAFGGRLAIVLSALLFSVQHMNAAQLVHQFILGMVLAYVVLKTDNLWYAIAIHFLNNLAAQLLNLVQPLNSFLAIFSWSNFGVLFAISAAGAVLLAGTLLILKKSKSCGFSLQKREQLQQADIFAVASVVVLYIIIWVITAVAK